MPLLLPPELFLELSLELPSPPEPVSPEPTSLEPASRPVVASLTTPESPLLPEALDTFLAALRLSVL